MICFAIIRNEVPTRHYAWSSRYPFGSDAIYDLRELGERIWDVYLGHCSMGGAVSLHQYL